MLPVVWRTMKPQPLGWIWALVLVCLLSACLPGTGAYGASYEAQRQFTGKGLELAAAAERGDAEAIRRLMKDEGVNPDEIYSQQGNIPLIAWPVLQGSYEGLKAMLEHGADPNVARVYPRQPHDDPDEIAYFSGAMVYAAKQEDPRYIELLLKHGGNPNAYNANFEPLLYIANGTLTRNWAIMQALVRGGADIDAETMGLTNTWRLANLGNFKEVYWMLEHGADPMFPRKAYVLAPRGSRPDPNNSLERRLLDKEGNPVTRIRYPVAEEIFWRPVIPGSEGEAWQLKCQEWLVARGIEPMPAPAGTREERIRQGHPDTPGYELVPLYQEKRGIKGKKLLPANNNPYLETE